MISEHSYLAALVYRCACVIQIHVPSRLCAVTDSMHGLQKMKCSLGETDKKNYHLNLLSFIDFIGFHVMVLYMMQNNNEMVCTRMMCLRSTVTVEQNGPDQNLIKLQGRIRLHLGLPSFVLNY